MSDQEGFPAPGDFAAEVLTEMLLRSGFSGCEVESVDDGERIRLTVTTADEEDTRLLVGRQGNTMAAYQFLVTRIVQQEFEGRVRISLDVAGYGESRRSRLEELGARIAETARSKKLEIRLVGMNPADRRSVHMSLAERRNIKTWSENEGIARRLVIRGS